MRAWVAKVTHCPPPPPPPFCYQFDHTQAARYVQSVCISQEVDPPLPLPSFADTIKIMRQNHEVGNSPAASIRRRAFVWSGAFGVNSYMYF